MREQAGKKPLSAELHLSGLYGQVVRRMLLFIKRHMTARLEFDKQHLKDSESMMKKTLWSDETTTELLG